MLRLDKVHPLVSGNKWLKQAYWLQTYTAGSYSGILTKGGPWSNHLHACAASCAAAGIPLQAIVKCAPGYSTATLQDVQQMGAQLLYAHRPEYYDEAHWAQYAQVHHLLYIPMGGEGPEGIAGVKEGMEQLLASQAFDTLMVSMGTGTTLLGIAQSKIACSKIIGIDPGTGDKNLFARIQTEAATLSKQLVLRAYPGKFGKGTDARIEFIKDWHARTGIVLDWVYTAPLCMEFVKMYEEGQFARGERVLLVHTGGLQGNRSQDTLSQLMA